MDALALSKALAVPVVETIGVRAGGDEALRVLIEDKKVWTEAIAMTGSAASRESGQNPAPATSRAHETAGDHETVRGILRSLNIDDQFPHTQSDRIDRVVLHPVLGRCF